MLLRNCNPLKKKHNNYQIKIFLQLHSITLKFNKMHIFRFVAILFIYFFVFLYSLYFHDFSFNFIYLHIHSNDFHCIQLPFIILLIDLFSFRRINFHSICDMCSITFRKSSEFAWVSTIKYHSYHHHIYQRIKKKMRINFYLRGAFDKLIRENEPPESNFIINNEVNVRAKVMNL